MIPLMEQRVAFLLLYNTKMNMKSISHRIHRDFSGVTMGHKSMSRRIETSRTKMHKKVDW